MRGTVNDGFSTRGRPLVIGHRGASGHAVENSSHALALALDLGCDGVEIDVHVTRDGEIVVHHDAALHPGLEIADLTAAEVATVPLPDDTPVPLLREVLRQLTPSMHVFVEAKGLPASADDVLLKMIDEAPDPSRIHVHAFDHRIIARLGQRRPALSRGILSASYPIDPVGPARAVGATVLWQEHHLIDAALVERCSEAGVRVIAWTVNTRQDAERVAALGVHGVCGNWPERLRPLTD